MIGRRKDGDATAGEERVIRALSEYARLCERGNAPDIEAFAARFPEIEKRLLACLSTLAALDDATPPRTAEPAPDGRDTLQRLGDYRLVREIGRGGMGVVFEAEQVSLQRRVAVKVLPLANALDPGQLQRFRNEALVVAQLDHEHIVPVHATGCDGGVHYYAMQLVDGWTLAEMVRHVREGDGAAVAPLRDPPGTPGYFRAVAGWIADAADAIQHAHEHDVIHRDIKPSNLLLDRDGHVRVADFGLARLQGTRSVTFSGDIVGTLRYMSPEQARGGRRPVDQRTDVYSLGATLYELLTLTPVFSGEDREEILRRVTIDDPVRPTRIEPKIPRDLETITLKALSKELGGRYDAAGELADDLRRFRQDLPIVARRPGILDRGAKWARRHRSLSYALALFLFLLLIGSTASSLLIWHEQSRTEEALVEANSQRERAEENLARAREVIQTMLTRVASRDLADIPQIEPLREQLFDAALAHLRALLDTQPDDIETRLELADTYCRKGELLAWLNRHAESGEAFREGLRALDTAPGDALRGSSGGDSSGGELSGDEYALAHATVLSLLAGHAIVSGDYPMAFAQLEASGERLERPALAEGLRTSVTLLRARNAARFGEARWNLRQLARARRAREEAVGLLRSLTEQEDAPRDAFYDLASNLSALGVIHASNLRPETALERFKEGLATLVRLPPVEHTSVRYRQSLAAVQTWLGGAHMELGNMLTARALFARARAVYDQLAADFPTVGTYPAESGLQSLYTAFAYMREDDWERALAELLPAWEALSSRLDIILPVYSAQSLPGKCLRAICAVVGQLDDREEAERTLGRVVAMLGRLLDMARFDPQAARWLLESHDQLVGSFGVELGDADLQRRVRASLEALARRDEVASAIPLQLARSLERVGETRAALRLLERTAARQLSSPVALEDEIEKCRGAIHPALASYASIDAVLDRGEELVAEGEDWRFLRGLRPPSGGLAWTADDFDDSGWEVGPSGFGYDDEDDRTVLADMIGRYSSVYARRRFSVAEPDSIDALRLVVKADDGCIAFLNGVEIARVRVASGAPPPHDALATTWAAEPPIFETVRVDPGLLRAGPNVLAVQGLNQSLTSSDFSLVPRLVATRRDGREQDARQRLAGLVPDSPTLGEYLEAEIARRTDGPSGDRDAVSLLESVVERDPQSPEPVSRLARSLRSTGRSARALDVVTGALRRGVESAALWRLWLELVASDTSSPAQVLARLDALAATRGGETARTSERDAPGALHADLRWTLERLAEGTLRLNCGGEAHRDAGGREWATDRFFGDGKSFVDGADQFYNGEVHGTDVPEIYRTERWFVEGGDSAYRLLLPPGRYRVTLHFAEITRHSRSFHASIEGVEVLRDYEPLDAGRATADVHRFEVEVRDAQLDVEFLHVENNPKISALEVEWAGA